MNTIHGMVMAAVVTVMASTASAAPMSPVEAATVCKTQAASQYASGERLARVKFKGIYGGNLSPRVRLQVLPPEGKAFLAICAVDGRSGEVVGLAPVRRDNTPVLAALH